MTDNKTLQKPDFEKDIKLIIESWLTSMTTNINPDHLAKIIVANVVEPYVTPLNSELLKLRERDKKLKENFDKANEARNEAQIKTYKLERLLEDKDKEIELYQKQIIEHATESMNLTFAYHQKCDELQNEAYRASSAEKEIERLKADRKSLLDQLDRAGEYGPF